MSSYPKWLYHASKPATVVNDAEAEKALGAGWVESPADLAKHEPKGPAGLSEGLAPPTKAHHAHADEETHPKKHK